MKKRFLLAAMVDLIRENEERTFREKIELRLWK